MNRQADARVRTGFKPDVVVLGAAGAIGHHIVKAFAGKGMQVAAVSHAPAMRNAGANVHFLQGDVCDSDALARRIGDAPFLVNAARPEISEDWAECEHKVQEAIIAVSSACKRAGVKRPCISAPLPPFIWAIRAMSSPAVRRSIPMAGNAPPIPAPGGWRKSRF